MIIKACGIMILFIVCSAAGILASFNLSKRVSQLESFIGAVNLIATEIRYFASPLEDILRKATQTNEYRELMVFGLCSGFLSETHDFDSSWQNAVKQARQVLSLNDDDAAVLLRFGNELGKTDIEGQLANCARCTELLSERLSAAREDKTKKGKMYSSLGVLAGVFFLVLFI